MSHDKGTYLVTALAKRHSGGWIPFFVIEHELLSPSIFKKKSHGDIVNTSIHPSAHPPACLSVQPSGYLLLNHWVEFYQTCHITSPHGKGVQEQHYFSVCLSAMCMSSFHLSVTPKLQGGIQPKLLHHFPSWYGSVRATLCFHVCPSVCPLSVYLPVTLSPPKPLGRIQPNLLHHLPSW